MKDKTTSNRTYSIVVLGKRLNARLLSEILSAAPHDATIYRIGDHERGWYVGMESSQFTDIGEVREIRPLRVISSREEMFEELEAFAYDAP